jgi:cytochrome c biogenesis protein CcdA
VGFSTETEREIREVVTAAITGETPASEPAEGTVTLPIIGVVDASSTSLVVGTLVIGFVDGFNPCSLWALSMLLALVLRTGSRRRVLAVGSVFLVITAGLYGLYMAGLYGTLQFVAQAGWIRVGIAVVALTFGLVNLKDYWWFRKGPSLTISEKAKPGLYQKMRAVASDERSLPAVLGGTILLAAGVSLLETPCTAGYPLLWANLLSAQGVTTATAMGLFGLYMIVFLADELAVFGTAVVAMRVTKLDERHGRLLKLVSGMLMVVLALALVVAPRLMESVAGAGLTFAVAAAATMLVLVIDKSPRGPRRPRQRPHPDTSRPTPARGPRSRAVRR